MRLGGEAGRRPVMQAQGSGIKPLSKYHSRPFLHEARGSHSLGPYPFRAQDFHLRGTVPPYPFRAQVFHLAGHCLHVSWGARLHLSSHQARPHPLATARKQSERNNKRRRFLVGPHGKE